MAYNGYTHSEYGPANWSRSSEEIYTMFAHADWFVKEMVHVTWKTEFYINPTKVFDSYHVAFIIYYLFTINGLYERSSKKKYLLSQIISVNVRWLLTTLHHFRPTFKRGSFFVTFCCFPGRKKRYLKWDILNSQWCWIMNGHKLLKKSSYCKSEFVYGKFRCPKKNKRSHTGLSVCKNGGNHIWGERRLKRCFGSIQFQISR